MTRLLRKNKGQSTLEYAILIVVVIMALIGIQGYISRAVQGRGRDASDQIGDQFHAATFSSNMTTTTFANITEAADPYTTTTNYTAQNQDRSGWEKIGNWSTMNVGLQ